MVLRGADVFYGPQDILACRRLSAQEAELLEQYRALTENDQVEMRYLIGAMKSISRF